MKNKIAIMYDFDDTLIKGCIQEYEMFKNLGVSSPNDFWNECNSISRLYNMDMMLGAMYFFVLKAKEKNINLTKEFLNAQGKNVEYFPGVLTWFDRINEFGKEHNMEVEHYIISAGVKEILDGIEIKDKFKKIFASEYIYDKNGTAIWPSQIVNFTTKTQYIARIRKGCLDDLFDTKQVNAKVKNYKKLLPYANMIYLGDGYTDVPCMNMVKAKGGTSISVYKDYDENSKAQAFKLYKDKRVNAYCPADYSENSELDKLVKSIILSAKEKLLKEK